VISTKTMFWGAREKYVASLLI